MRGTTSMSPPALRGRREKPEGLLGTLGAPLVSRTPTSSEPDDRRRPAAQPRLTRTAQFSRDYRFSSGRDSCSRAEGRATRSGASAIAPTRVPAALSITLICVTPTACGILAHASRRRSSKFWLCDAVDATATRADRGFGSPEFSPRLPCARSPVRQKIVICRDEEGERRD